MISGLPVSRLKALLVALLLVLAPLAALAQTSPDAPRTETTESSTTSQGLDAAVSSALSAASGAIEGASGGVGQSSILLFLGLTVLSLAPAIAITVTCFPFMVTVLSILRQSLGLQQSPPNMLIVSLALFLTWFVMDPVLQEAWGAGIGPFSRGELPLEQSLDAYARGVGLYRQCQQALEQAQLRVNLLNDPAQPDTAVAFDPPSA